MLPLNSTSLPSSLSRSYSGPHCNDYRSLQIRAGLARLPLQYGETGEGRNEEVANAIIETLLDKSVGDGAIARLYENAFKHNYVKAFSNFVQQFEEQYGLGKSRVNANVKEILAGRWIDLNTDGRAIQMRRLLPLVTLEQSRHEVISTTLSERGKIPGPVVGLIREYAYSIDFSVNTIDIHAEILGSDDTALKDDLVEAICAQGEIPFFNQLIGWVGLHSRVINLSAVSLQLIASQSLRLESTEIIYLFVRTLAASGSNDEATALFFKNAFDDNYQPAINDSIKKQVAKYGRHAVEVRNNVKLILLRRGIHLTQDSSGSVTMSGDCAVADAPERRHTIDQVLLKRLPKDLTDLISGYDDQFKFCSKNNSFMADIFRADDPTSKSLLVEAASQQGQIHHLNQVFEQIKKSGHRLNLSHTYLCDLTLQDIDLSEADLSYAVLQDTDLSKAKLTQALLCRANLTGAIMTDVCLTKADLTYAMLIGANLERANFDGAKLISAVLKLAILRLAQFTLETDLTDANFDYADLLGTLTCQSNLTNSSLTDAILHQRSWFTDPHTINFEY